jgi:hypothetical protein
MDSSNERKVLNILFRLTTPHPTPAVHTPSSSSSSSKEDEEGDGSDGDGGSDGDDGDNNNPNRSSHSRKRRDVRSVIFQTPVSHKPLPVSQIFVISPKLLPGLHFSEGSRVIIPFDQYSQV